MAPCLLLVEHQMFCLFFTYPCTDEYKAVADEFSKHHFPRGIANPDAAERRYWSIVEEDAGNVTVLYGSELDSGSINLQKCPLGKCVNGQSQTEDRVQPEIRYSAKWTLPDLYQLPQSLLKNAGQIPGVTCPWVYVVCYEYSDIC